MTRCARHRPSAGFGAAAGGFEDVSGRRDTRRARARASARSARITCRRPAPNGPTLADLADIEWHLIGPLQSNKARAAAACFDWVESVDRLQIARPAVGCARGCLERARRAGAGQRQRRGDEERRGARRGARRSRATLRALPNLRLRGIMGIPGADRRTSSGCAASSGSCAHASTRARDAGLAVDTLSMGMSADLELAIARRRDRSAHRHRDLRSAQASRRVIVRTTFIGGGNMATAHHRRPDRARRACRATSASSSRSPTQRERAGGALSRHRHCTRQPTRAPSPAPTSS